MRPLFGRKPDQIALERLLDRGRRGGAALVVAGEAGIGKSALLDWTAQCAEARGALVLRCRGVPEEAVLPFAALADLLLPVTDHLNKLPAPQQEALAVSLSLGRGRSAGPLAARLGTLRLLSLAADERPVVILVDDHQWLDTESAEVLSFVARRVWNDPVAMVIAVRDEPDGSPVPWGLDTIRPGSLSLADCEDLAESMGVVLTSGQLADVLDSTGGNPLAVVEALTAIGTTGSAPPDHLPASLDATWGRMWTRLPAPTRLALLLVALDRAAGGRHAVKALERMNLTLADLAPAERLNLVHRMDDGLELRHALLPGRRPQPLHQPGDRPRPSGARRRRRRPCPAVVARRWRDRPR